MNSTLDALWLSQFVQPDGTLDLAALEDAEQKQPPPDSDRIPYGGLAGDMSSRELKS